MKEIIYENTMGRIKSMYDVFAYRVADFEISLDELEMFLPEEVNESIVIPNTVNCLYVADSIYPSMLFNSADKFFLKNKNQFLESNFKGCKENLPSNCFLDSLEFHKNGFRTSFLNLSEVFGNSKISLTPSLKAIRKVMCYWVMDLWMKHESVHHYKQTILNLPAFCDIFPSGIAENWLGQTIPLDFRSDSYPWKIDEELFERYLSRKLMKFPQTKFLTDFFDKDRDNFYYLDCQKENLILTKGIDHKYVPYYKAKFCDDNELSTT